MPSSTAVLVDAGIESWQGRTLDDQSAARDLERLKAAAPSLDAHVTATLADGESQ
jgi:hypothetical protein